MSTGVGESVAPSLIKNWEETGMPREDADEFSVTHLVCGWDDVRLPLAMAHPNEVWDVVSAWPPRRLAAALVAAVTVMPTGEADAVTWPDGWYLVVTGQVCGVRGSGRASGQVAATERSR